MKSTEAHLAQFRSHHLPGRSGVPCGCVQLSLNASGFRLVYASGAHDVRNGMWEHFNALPGNSKPVKKCESHLHPKFVCVRNARFGPTSRQVLLDLPPNCFELIMARRTEILYADRFQMSLTFAFVIFGGSGPARCIEGDPADCYTESSFDGS